MRPASRLRFVLERYLVRGAHYQLLAVAAMIGLISVLGGVLVRWSAGGEGGVWDSVWWAFLRLTDPGYLGDDTGLYPRVISTILTVLGYVLFMGSLVAILTQWLNSTMRRFESGITPVTRKNHVLILGWTTRAGIVIRDLFLSEGRVRRFLKRRGAKSLHIVLMAEEAGPHLMQEIRSRVGHPWNPRQITLRSGSALRGDHLPRVDFLRAAVILLPAGEFSESGPENADTLTVKALLSLSNHPLARDAGDLPLAVVEVFDARKEDVARKAYSGPVEVLASDAVISRLVAQCVRHPGLSPVFNELLTHGEGNEIYARELPELTGEPIEGLGSLFPSAVLMGVVRTKGGIDRPYLNAPAGFRLEADDRLVLMARSYKDTLPAKDRRAEPVERGSCALPEGNRETARRVLVLGWSRKVPTLMAEFASYPNERFDLHVVSAVPVAERQAALDKQGGTWERVQLTQHEADYTVVKDLERVDPAGYDNVVMVGSDWLPSGEESDARTIMGYLLLQEALERGAGSTHLLVELLDPENAGLLGRRSCEVIISPVILSHMLAQVALRRELSCVFAELFTTGGPEIVFQPVSQTPFQGETVTFSEIEKQVWETGCTALGLHIRSTGGNGGTYRINPEKAERFTLSGEDELILLSTYG